jgi:dipeptide/tripeptide permease
VNLPGSGLGPFNALVAHMCYALTHGGGWRAWFNVIGFLLLPVFFVVTLVANLMPSHDVDVLPTDPCLQNAPSQAPRRLSGGGGGAGIWNNTALIIGSVAVILLVVANLNTKYIQDMPRGSRKKDGEDGSNAFSAADCRQALSIVPLLIVINIGFNLAYNAMNNAFVSSACQMDTILGNEQLNGAFYNIADAIAIIVFTPLFEACLFPFIAYLKGSPVRTGQKIIAGLLIAALSNAAAAYLEIKRRAAPYLCPTDLHANQTVSYFSKCAPGYDDGIAGTRMKEMSAFWIFIPFTLIGIAEILVNPCLYCIAYEAAPVQMRSLVQAFQLFCMGCLSNAFTAAVMASTLPNNLDEGNLEYYYFINIVFAFISVGLYFVLTRCFANGTGVNDVAALELDVMETDIDAELDMIRIRSLASGRA